MTRTTTPPAGGAPPADRMSHVDNALLLILLLFVHARIMMLVILPADDMTLYGDYQYYFDLASFSAGGYLPYIHYWSEYPPLFPFLNLALYWLSGGVFHRYVVFTGLFFLAFEAGALVLLYRLAKAQHHHQQAIHISWIYTVLYLPAFIWLRQFDIMAAFAILLALFTLRQRRLALTGLIIGLGTAVKIVPILLLATVWRARGRRAALVSGAAALLAIAVILGPLLIWSPVYSWASIIAQPSKSSWQTIWALIDGNLYNTGNFGAIEEHFEPAMAATPLYNPARLPAWLTAIPFVMLGLFILLRPAGPSRVTRATQMAHFPQMRLYPASDATITALILTFFFLWSKGWSPQWQVFLFPLLLLALPLWRAATFILIFSTINFIEWPIILSRGLVEYLPFTIVARTLLLIFLALMLYQELNKPVIVTKVE